MTWRRIALVLACSGGCKPASDGPILLKYVDELVPADHDRELRVRGTIAGPIYRNVENGETITVFSLEHHNATLRVLATGVLPEQFRERWDGVVEGRWLTAAEARPILVARGVSSESEIFDARNVWARLPDFTLGSAAQ